jgi:hypothetical protein
MKKTTLILALIAVLALGGCTAKLEKSYNNEEYSFTYPTKFSVQEKGEGVEALTIIYKENSILAPRIEIFSFEDFDGGYRPYGFGDPESKANVNNYIAKEKIVLSDDYQAWLYYGKLSFSAKKQLRAIAESIELNELES